MLFFQSHRVDNICLYRLCLTLFKLIDVFFPDTLYGRVVHLFNRPPISRAKYDSPPVIRGVKNLPTIFRDDLGLLNAGIGQ